MDRGGEQLMINFLFCFCFRNNNIFNNGIFKYIGNYLCRSGSLVKVAPPWVLPQSTIMAVPGGPDYATMTCCDMSIHVWWDL